MRSLLTASLFISATVALSQVSSIFSSVLNGSQSLTQPILDEMYLHFKSEFGN
jgi:hypothetical protein